MSERFVESNGVRLWTEDFGDPNHPTLLLAMGASAQGVAWPDEFCARLVENRLHIIRYDHRDTGMSTCFDFDKHPYSLDELTADAVGILDAYEIHAAHTAGVSMGGMICQCLAINYPQRVKSLASIMSSPIAGTGSDEIVGQGPTDLPGPSQEFIEKFAAYMGPPPAAPEERIERRVQIDELLAGSLAPFDREARRQIAALEVSRETDPLSPANHGAAVERSRPADRRPSLSELSVPSLVIHGTEDPILLLEHGIETAEVIPSAQLIVIERLGHELPKAAWPQIIDPILALINGVEGR